MVSVFLLSILFGCRSSHNTITVRDTVLVRDTIAVRHTATDVFRVRDTARVYIQTTGDTVRVSTERVVWRDRVVAVHDTVEHITQEKSTKETDKERVIERKNGRIGVVIVGLASVVVCFFALRLRSHR